MHNDNGMDEKLSGTQTRKKRTEILSQQIADEDVNRIVDTNADRKGKRCLPGFNSCDVGGDTGNPPCKPANELPDANAEKKRRRCLPGFNSCNVGGDTGNPPCKPAHELPDANAERKRKRCLPGFNSCDIN